MRCPCKGCTERTITCHGVCRKYQDWKAEHEEAKKWLNDQKYEPSERCIKGQHERIRKGIAMRKWNVKTKNGGDGRW